MVYFFRSVLAHVVVPAVLLVSAASLVAGEPGEWRELFDGESLDGWTTVLSTHEPGEDPNDLVQVREGTIHMYADTDPSETVPFGVIVHDDTFSRFHFSLEYRWIGKRFAPRKNELRDAGILFHSEEVRSIWPNSVECQIQEGDTGDIVFLESAGLTWHNPDPDNAPEGQGTPGALPEHGGTPADYSGVTFAYIGRFPVLDTMEGWNRVEVIAHAESVAEYIVNGETVARLTHMQTSGGEPLGSGKIALQLEGAEIQYRNIRIRELEAPLQPDRGVVSLSAVEGRRAKAGELKMVNPGGREVPAPLTVEGKDKDAFTVSSSGEVVSSGEPLLVTVEFDPVRGAGRYSAGLRIGDPETGPFVILQGVGQNAMEGNNEPVLQSIVNALGVPLDVGGKELGLDTRQPTIGDSIDVRFFRAADDGYVRITPVARYSPTGQVPFGFTLADSESLVEVGRLADSTATIPDAHQSLFPPLAGGEEFVEFLAPDGPLAIYMIGHLFTSSTDPERPSEATILHTARVYPVAFFQGRQLENAFLIGFEEASNGDYQDALFLLENVRPVR